MVRAASDTSTLTLTSAPSFTYCRRIGRHSSSSPASDGVTATGSALDQCRQPCNAFAASSWTTASSSALPGTGIASVGGPWKRRSPGRPQPSATSAWPSVLPRSISTSACAVSSAAAAEWRGRVPLPLHLIAHLSRQHCHQHIPTHFRYILHFRPHHRLLPACSYRPLASIKGRNEPLSVSIACGSRLSKAYCG